MLVRSMKTPFAVVAVVALLAACGGGGGGGGGSSSTSTPTVATTFNLERAYHAEIQALGTGSFAISGDCTGTGTVTKSRANFATFEGTFAVGVDITTNLTFTNCVPSNRSTTVTEWYRTGNLMAFGSSIAGGDYGVFLAEPSALPSAATIGSSGVFGTQTIYTDSTKTTIKALDDYSWAVEADGGSTTTAIAVLTVRRYSPGRATLLSTQTTRHRIMSSGVYSPISTELVQTSPTSLRLTYTPL